jgi:thioredoxin reductase (NADPH)
MQAAVEGLREELLPFELEIRDVDADPSLDRFNELVPVLAHGDRELARYRLDPAALRAYLSGIR